MKTFENMKKEYALNLITAPGGNYTAKPKQVKFTNCSQFLSHNYFGLDFHFNIIFLHIGMGQLDNDV